jgi:hypothetical protein
MASPLTNVSLLVIDWFKDSFSCSFQLHYFLLTIWSGELARAPLAPSTQNHLSRCRIAHPFSPELTFKFRRLIMRTYSLREWCSAPFEIVRLPWNNTQVLSAVKAFKYAILGMSYSDELHYKLFKNMSVELHPFVKLYNSHLHQSELLHRLSSALMVSSEKSPFDDFMIFVLLFESKKLSCNFEYLELVLSTVAEKGMLRPFETGVILQKIGGDYSTKQAKAILAAMSELLVLRKGLIHEQEASLASQIEVCIARLGNLLNQD